MTDQCESCFANQKNVSEAFARRKVGRCLALTFAWSEVGKPCPFYKKVGETMSFEDRVKAGKEYAKDHGEER